MCYALLALSPWRTVHGFVLTMQDGRRFIIDLHAAASGIARDMLYPINH